METWGLNGKPIPKQEPRRIKGLTFFLKIWLIQVSQMTLSNKTNNIRSKRSKSTCS